MFPRLLALPQLEPLALSLRAELLALPPLRVELLWVELLALYLRPKWTG
jgi:hypothetical protein